jgi:hypothetical protein
MQGYLTLFHSNDGAVLAFWRRYFVKSEKFKLLFYEALQRVSLAE